MSRFGGITLLVLVLLSTASATASAQWMWRDKTRGDQITYSDRPPPPDVAEKDILKRPGDERRRAAAPAPAPTASEAALATPRLVDTSLEAKRKEAEKQAAAQKKKEEEKTAAARAENCERSRKHLQALESGARMSRTNAKGEQEPMDDAARADEVRRAREVMASECKK